MELTFDQWLTEVEKYFTNNVNWEETGYYLYDSYWVEDWLAGKTPEEAAKIYLSEI